MAKLEHFDVLIVGAGLSGIGAAWHLQKRLPGKRFAIFEARAAIGGTWDLFRYPGVRSDSDMFTLGYRFRPWTKTKTLAGGDDIRAYVADTAREFGIDQKIRYSHRVTQLSWSSKDALWTVRASTPAGDVAVTCRFLWMCSGYYRYAAGYTPEWPGRERFQGPVIHPQSWPQGLDCAGKHVLLIGSGATAVTLAPALARAGARVTMLQRSPTYMYSLPSVHPIAKFLTPFLPKSIVYRIVRLIAVPLQMHLFSAARRNPAKARSTILDAAREALPADIDFEKHFSPRYNPWEERLCFVEDDDFFAAVREKKVSMATDEIETFTESGVLLKSGGALNVDTVVTATGLELEMLGGAEITLDGAPVDIGRTVTYKGVMYSGVPNLAAVFGYLNASWTLRADLISDFVCRLIKFLDRNGYEIATPVYDGSVEQPKPFSDFSSGYLKRAERRLPKQAGGAWRHPQNFFVDLFALRWARLDGGGLRFSRAENAASRIIAPTAAAAE